MPKIPMGSRLKSFCEYDNVRQSLDYTEGKHSNLDMTSGTYENNFARMKGYSLVCVVLYINRQA